MARDKKRAKEGRVNRVEKRVERAEKRIDDYKERGSKDSGAERNVERGVGKGVFRCRHCHGAIGEDSTFCHYCGAKVVRSDRIRHKTCPNCKSMIDEHAAYCRHCGADARKFSKRHHISVMLYLITLLLVAIILLIFFSYPTTREDVSVESGEGGFGEIEITDISCEWSRDHFRICESVDWSGNAGDYVKAYIPGGEDLETSEKWYDRPFVYCQDIGKDEGYRVVRALLFDETENSYKDIGKGVECKTSEIMETDTKGVIAAKRSGDYRFAKRLTFRAQTNTGHGAGFGQVEIKMPGVPVSCNLDGEYVTDDKEFSGIQQYCHKAIGKLNGYFDSYEQYVEEDPEFFRWAGDSKPASNPLPRMYEGEILHVRLCDNRYYQEDGERYYVKARVTSLEPLKIDWEYFNDDTRPAVDFTFTLDCMIKG